MHQILDSTAPLDFFAKNGYYIIGDKIANHVGTAYQEATRTKLPIRWHFNDEVYNSFNWRERLNLPINELYRMRAQQLRDKYDYLILWFSGGADSTNILHAFVDNNIHLDEVQIVWPRSQTAGKYTPNNKNRSATNIVSEWDFSAEPTLKWLAANHPTTRIEVLDQFKTIDVEDFEDTWTLLERHNYGSIEKQRLFDRELRDRSKKYKNIASITGNNPVVIKIIDNKWIGTYFNNAWASAANGKSDYLLDGTPRNVEYFYWTPDFPEITRQQAHIVLDYLNLNPAARQIFESFMIEKKKTPKILFDPTWKLNEGALLEERELIKKLIYPTWNMNTFSAAKCQNTYDLVDYHYWYFNSNPETKRHLESWRSAIQAQYSLISNQWFNKHDLSADKFHNFYSKMYLVGRLI